LEARAQAEAKARGDSEAQMKADAEATENFVSNQLFSSLFYVFCTGPPKC
jgi:hypothetical protein